jgi:hypothetical protein
MPIASTDLTTARDLDAALWEVPRRRSAKELFRERREALIRAFDRARPQMMPPPCYGYARRMSST